MSVPKNFTLRDMQKAHAELRSEFKREMGSLSTAQSLLGSRVDHDDNADWDGHTELSDVAWDDLVVTQGDFKVPTSSAPTDNSSWLTNLIFADFAQGDYVNFEGVQFPHRRAAGSDAMFHVHFSPLSDITDGETIIWSLDYSVASPFTDYPATVNLTTTYTNDADARALLTAQGSSAVSGTTILASAKPHLITASGEIDGSDISLSAILSGKLSFSSSSTYSGNAIFHSCDFHIQIDRLGSENEFTD